MVGHRVGMGVRFICSRDMVICDERLGVRVYG